MLNLLIAAGTLSQPQTVTFEHPCANSTVVLEALGKQIGRPIKPSGSVNKDYFLVRFDEVPIQEAMNKIASTLNATWTEKYGVLYLGRTAAHENQDRKESIATDASFLQAGLARTDLKAGYNKRHIQSFVADALTILKKEQEGTQLDGREILAINANTPAARFVARVCAEIGYENIVNTGDFGVTEYVLNPGILQRKLPELAALRLFKQESKLLRDSIDVATQDELGNYWMTSAIGGPFGNYGEGFYFYNSLRVRSLERGLLMLSYYSKDSGDYDALYRLAERNASGIAPELLAMDASYEPTDLERAFAGFLATYAQTEYETVIKVDGDLADVFADPLSHEPLTEFGSNWLLASASLLGKNMVAVIDDNAYNIACYALSRKTPQFRTMWRALGNTGGGYVAKQDGGWLTVVPKKRDKVRAARVDRAKLRDLLRPVDDPFALPLEHLSGFYALNESAEVPALASDALKFLHGRRAEEQFYNDQSGQILAVYGHMTPNQQALAHTGGYLFAVQGLSEPLKRFVGSYAFNGMRAISKEHYDGKWQLGYRLGQYSEETDPLRIFTNGFPIGSKVRVRVDSFPIMFQKTKNPDERPNRIEFVGSGISSTHTEGTAYEPLFAVVHTRQIVLEIEWQSVGFQFGYYHEQCSTANVDWVPVDALPQQFQDHARLALKPVTPSQEVRSGGGG